MIQLKLTSLFCLFNIHYILIGHLFAGTQQLGTRAAATRHNSFYPYFLLFLIFTQQSVVSESLLNQKLE